MRYRVYFGQVNATNIDVRATDYLQAESFARGIWQFYHGYPNAVSIEIIDESKGGDIPKEGLGSGVESEASDVG